MRRYLARGLSFSSVMSGPCGELFTTCLRLFRWATSSSRRGLAGLQRQVRKRGLLEAVKTTIVPPKAEELTRVRTTADLLHHAPSPSILEAAGHASLPVARNRPAVGWNVFGENIPSWVLDRSPYEGADVYALSYARCCVWPLWGIVMPQSGALLEPSLKAARWKSPDLTQVPGLYSLNGSLRFSLVGVRRAHLSGAYLVLNHWGGKNYGHFIFDSLPGVLWFREELLRGSLRLLTSPLHPWQRDLLGLLDIGADSIVETRSQLCECDRLIWPSFLNDNLNRPACYTRRVRDAFLANAGLGEDREPCELLYISRRNQRSRQMANDEQLSAALSDGGFRVVCPEDLSVATQIALFSRARVVVGETGAALANVLFAPTGCTVVEIMPETKPSAWTKRVCGLLDMPWYCVYSRVPSEGRTVSVVDGVAYENLVFSYSACIEDVITALQHAHVLE